MDENTTKVMYLLHEMVLSKLMEKVNDDECDVKTLQAAMQFLKDNDIRVSLTGQTQKEALQAQLSTIPRLTAAELELG